MRESDLRELVITSLEQQGFRIESSRILPLSDPSKETLRRLHAVAVESRLEKAKKGLQPYESK
jgi:hypothetical protein